MQRESVEVSSRFIENQLLDGLAWNDELGVIALQPAESCHRLEAKETIPVCQGLDQHVHRPLARKTSKRGGYVTSHPRLLVFVLEEIGQRFDHLVAMADE